MTRMAMLVGITEYDHPALPRLDACARDAQALKELLARHHDNKQNYECFVATNETGANALLTRAGLRGLLHELFASDDEVLFYFAGHGAPLSTGGILCTTDGVPNDLGVPMSEVMQLANQSRARDVIVILDCCHSGDLGNLNLGAGGIGAGAPLALLRDNVTIIAAARPAQLAYEVDGHGVFTGAVLDALSGGAADHIGLVTPTSLYAYVERQFGAWGGQRPVYKSHASRVPIIRECAPLIERLKLQDLVTHFPTVDHKYQLDADFDPEDADGRLPERVDLAKFALGRLFKDYRDAGLLKPSVPGEQLFWTARRGHTVELTPRGREYWFLVKNDRI